MFTIQDPELSMLRSASAAPQASDAAAAAAVLTLPSVTRPDARHSGPIPQISVTSHSIPGMFTRALPAPFSGDDLIQMLCGSFDAERERLGADPDPSKWTEEDVQDWLTWTMKEFNMCPFDRDHFRVDGRALCQLTKEQFLKQTPEYTADILHAHIQYLLRKARQSNTSFDENDVEALVKALAPDPVEFESAAAAAAAVAVASTQTRAQSRAFSRSEYNSPDTPPKSPPSSTDESGLNAAPLKNIASWMGSANSLAPPNQTVPRQVPSPASSVTSASHSSYGSPCSSPPPPGPSAAVQAAMTAAYTESSGPIQLWQFLLELLTDKRNMDCIVWTGREWEFKLTDPEVVAQRWGKRKNKPKMNYEKLSRGLRYYYDKNIIHKVPGKRYVYKFVCDLESLLGCTAQELQAQYHTEIPPLPMNPYQTRPTPPSYSAAVQLQQSSFGSAFGWNGSNMPSMSQSMPLNYF